MEALSVVVDEGDNDVDDEDHPPPASHGW